MCQCETDKAHYPGSESKQHIGNVSAMICSYSLISATLLRSTIKYLDQLLRYITTL